MPAGICARVDHRNGRTGLQPRNELKDEGGSGFAACGDYVATSCITHERSVCGNASKIEAVGRIVTEGSNERLPKRW